MRDVTDAVRIFLAPPENTLTVEQRSGYVCTWCPTVLAPGKGVSLGGTDTWHPHACRPCHAIQGQALAAYLDWNDHVTDCVICRTGPCETSLTLRHATVKARERAGWQPAYCTSCQNSFAPGEAFVPHMWIGTSSVVLSFLHTGPCIYPFLSSHGGDVGPHSG
ncbi:hypothetical protein ABT390_35515 [Streptomyces aurantiacus]|uniref:Uncharacterized protein n=1 Tax=Streptomyces aurantiacus JA 4570 TaxID=1286094 RepID=S3ZPB6_9ACTN|nr:hypothetical protein [Streptomyces aurantiacus]EPH45351.1 hypothetical protein STRAU_1616 [Streptomyces aurantiacus JA 4570]